MLDEARTYLKAAAILAIGTFLGFWFARTVLHFTAKGAALIGIGFALAAVLTFGRKR
jgi:hypothetical protein